MQAMKVANLDWQVSIVKNPLIEDSEGRVFESEKTRAVVREDNFKVLAFHGERYQPVQNEELFEVAYSLGKNGFRNSRLEIVQNAGHYVHEESPASVSQIIIKSVNFLTSKDE